MVTSSSLLGQVSNQTYPGYGVPSKNGFSLLARALVEMQMHGIQAE